MHPRLSLSEMCTYPLPFAEELELWDELGAHHVGVMVNKLAAHGLDDAIKQLTARSMRTVTVVGGQFNLAKPDSWPAGRQAVNQAVDIAQLLGGCVYFTPGRRDGRSFDELTASLAEAVAPCIPYAQDHGVRLAIEPSLRTDVSFVHTLRDGLDVAERAGIDVIADLGNCWAERDYEATVRRAGSRIAAVQFADALFGTSDNPPRPGRAVPGDGDLPIDQFIQAAVDAGDTGAFELEMVGPLIEQEGYAAALRRGVARADEILSRVLDGSDRPA